MKYLLTVLSILILLVPMRASACGDYCEDWGALYYTGGYNLYDFGVDLYDTSSYGTSGMDYSNWGGGCGSLISSCGNAYNDSSYTILIDTYTTMAGLCGTTCLGGSGSMPSAGWPYTNSPFTPEAFSPDSPFTSPFSPPMAQPFSPPFAQPPMALPPLPMPYLPPALNTPPPVGGIPPVTFNPYNPGSSPNIPGLSPPPSLPWGGCDNVIVMCPSGGVPPIGGGGGTYSPHTNTIPVSPVRIKIPRGVHL